jgi:Domain of unknown function DUF1828
MLCQNIQQIIGFECLPLDEQGKVARILSPFKFDDGDSIPIYIENVGNKIRFFDDGGVVMHFLSRGVSFANSHKTRFIKTATDRHGLTFTEFGEIEIWSNYDTAPQAFSKYLETLLSITNWENEQRGAISDVSLFIESIAFNLRSWKPHSQLIEHPEYTGISKQKYKLDFKLDQTGIIAVTTNANSISSSIKKILDIRAGSDVELDLLVVIDDRYDRNAANRESLIIQSVANVLPFTKLEQNAYRINSLQN